MDVKSSIAYIEKLGMYKIDLGFYTKYFDYIIYDYKNNSNFTFGSEFELLEIDKELKIVNKIIGITKFLDYFVVCIFDLDNFSSNYFLVKTANIFSYKLKNKDYIFMVYLDKDNNKKLFHNCFLEDFDIIYDNNIFEIINKIIDVKVFTKRIEIKTLEKKILDKGLIINQEVNSKLFDIADLYYFDDLFFKNNNIFFEELLSLINFSNDEDCKIQIEKLDNPLYPNYKIKFLLSRKNLEQNSFLPYLKLFLTINSSQYLNYTIDNEYLNSYFQYFENINQLNFDEINIEYKLPKDLLVYDKNFPDFQKSIMKLKYIIFILNTNLEEINNIKKDNNNLTELEKISYIRLGIQKENLENIIINYSEKLKEFLEKIII